MLKNTNRRQYDRSISVRVDEGLGGRVPSCYFDHLDRLISRGYTSHCLQLCLGPIIFKKYVAYSQNT